MTEIWISRDDATFNHNLEACHMFIVTSNNKYFYGRLSVQPNSWKVANSRSLGSKVSRGESYLCIT